MKARCGETFDGPVIPFGADISYDPSPPLTKLERIELVMKMLPANYPRCEQNAGGGWSGDLLVAEWEDIENLRVHLIHSHPKIQGSLHAIGIVSLPLC